MNRINGHKGHSNGHAIFVATTAEPKRNIVGPFALLYTDHQGRQHLDQLTLTSAKGIKHARQMLQRKRDREDPHAKLIDLNASTLVTVPA